MSDIDVIQDIADAVGQVPNDGVDSANMQKLMSACKRAAGSLKLDFFIDYGTAKDVALFLRNKISQAIDNMVGFVARARNSGLSIPDSPFVTIMSLNAGRPMFAAITITPAVASSLVVDINTTVDLFKKVSSGALELNDPLEGSSQISSYVISGESAGNPVSDSLGFVPSADQIKAQKTLDALAAVDFSKRKPKMLFTADYRPAGTKVGSIVCWKKMHDASSFVVTRKNMLDGEEIEYRFSADAMKQSTDALADYLDTWILSFYELDVEKVSAFHDDTVEVDKIYLYTVVALQESIPSSGNIFNIKSVPVFFSSTQVEEIKSLILSVPVLVAMFGGGAQQQQKASSPNPYPFISQKLYGDSTYDWILAAMNVKASYERKDSVERIRSFSYLGSTIEFMESEMKRGIFFAPNDLTDVVKNIERSISSFGVSRTVTDILDKTGMLFFFAQRDFSDNSTLDVSAGTLASIIESIDEENATVNPQRLLTNLTKATNTTTKPTGAGGVSQINTDTLDRTTDVESANDPVQFAEIIDDDSLLDLTMFDGISKFMRVIRLYFEKRSVG